MLDNLTARADHREISISFQEVCPSEVIREEDDHERSI